jgi:toxin YhaV
MDAPVVGGWTLFAHPLFLDQMEALAQRVEALCTRDPSGYRSRNDSKRLAATARLAFEVIPQDPTRGEYRQGNTLGAEHRHWFRAKFYQQYRLFFRFDSASRIIVYGWVNDADTKRAYGSEDDVYRMFSRMLAAGHPPGDWAMLLKEARTAARRLWRLQEKVPT